MSAKRVEIKFFVIGLLAGGFLVCLTAWYFESPLADYLYSNQTRIFYSLDEKRNDQELVRVIDSAQKYVYFAIYTFTKTTITDALVRAKKRGLTVEGIMDRSQLQSGFEDTVVRSLHDAGIPFEYQKHPKGIMHIKALVTESAYALGSYNWTASATSLNDELLEIGTNRSLHDQYLAILKRLLVVNM